MVRFRQLIARAKAKRIHEALGFKSWTAYVADVIGIEMTKLPVDDRRQIVALLAGEGIESTGDCAVVGVSQKTVDRDLDQVSHDDSPARSGDHRADATVTGLRRQDLPQAQA